MQEGDQEVRYREETTPSGAGWQIVTLKQKGRETWEATAPPVAWAYPFPPILAWQNLPVTDSPYGRSDIEGVIPIQDRYNFLVSNISKIVRLYAHPTRYARNLSNQILDGIATGPDEMSAWQGDGEIVQLPPVSDLPGAMVFLNSLRDAAFTLAREVDVSVFKDKVGAITNMGLRMMYKDALEKLSTKRLLYGAAYVELNRRMLILGGFEGETCIIHWPDPLPVNEIEQTAALTSDLNNKLCSIQTAREIRGYDPDQESARIAEEKTTSDNAGAVLLNDFFSRNKVQKCQPLTTSLRSTAPDLTAKVRQTLTALSKHTG